MIAEIIHALEAKKLEIAKEAIEKASNLTFDRQQGIYFGLDAAIQTVKVMVAEKGRINDDL